MIFGDMAVSFGGELFTMCVCASGSVKACYGHTEGAAGLQGAPCSILSLQINAAPPIMHLRNMNPYVSAALTDWASAGSLQGFIPRVRLFFCQAARLSKINVIGEM